MIEKIKRIYSENLGIYSEKFKLDLNYFISGSFWLTLKQIIVISTGFLISVLLANYLSKETFGQYSFITSILSVATIFGLPGLSQYVIKNLSQNKDGIYFDSLKEVFKWSFLGSLLLFSVAIYGEMNGNNYGSKIFLLLGIIFPIYSISNYCLVFFTGKKNFEIVSKISIFQSLLLTIGLSFGIINNYSLFWLIVLTIIPNLLLNYFTLIFVKKYLKNKKSSIKEIKEGKKFSISQGFSMIGLKVDSLIIAFLLGFEELAIFTIITLLPNQLKTLTNIFTPLILPKITSNKKTKKININQYFKYLLYLSIVLIIFYSIFAYPIFKIFYPKYLDYILLSIIFNLSFITFPSFILSNYLIKMKKTNFLIKKDVYSTIFLIFCSTIFIYILGLLGAIIARILYRTFNFGIILYYYNKTK